MKSHCGLKWKDGSEIKKFAQCIFIVFVFIREANRMSFDWEGYFFPLNVFLGTFENTQWRKVEQYPTNKTIESIVTFVQLFYSIDASSQANDFVQCIHFIYRGGKQEVI